MNYVERYAPLQDLQVRSEGTGRSVEALAAVFNTPTEIKDREGHYMEAIAPTAFDRTIAQRSGQIQVMFNHGKTMYGTPSERYSMPIGRATEIRVDSAGLFTRTEISKTPLGDEVLQLINDGAIRGMSFSGKFVASEPPKPQGSGLPLRVRTEIAMNEYGPTPFPAYSQAQITGVRSQIAEIVPDLSLEELLELLEPVGAERRAEIARALATADPGTGNDDPADTRTASVTRSQTLRELQTALARVSLP